MRNTNESAKVAEPIVSLNQNFVYCSEPLTDGSTLPVGRLFLRQNQCRPAYQEQGESA